MSERLGLPGIRAGAMEPPVGGAREYEQMLAAQFEQAGRDEEELRRESVRAATRRALDRSGWYNVGQMLIPQDAGEAVLGLAMGPGLGRGLRTALAALGGMTTQAGDAEGAFLPRRIWQALAAREQPATVRMEAQQMLDSFGQAQTRLREDVPAYAARLEHNDLFPRVADSQSLRYANEDFEFTAPRIFNETAWMPDPQVGWLGMASPERPRDLRAFDAAVQRVAHDPANQLETHILQDLVDDPVLAALGGPPRPAVGLEALTMPNNRWNKLDLEIERTDPSLNYLGYFDRNTNRPVVNVTANPASFGRAQARGTLGHELEHWTQNATNRPNGVSPQNIQGQNPPWLLEHFRDQGGYRSVTNPTLLREMRDRQSGEWYADIVAQIERDWAVGLPYGPEMRASTIMQTPDFRIRGVYE